MVRIISQDGTLDFPYERVILSCDEHNIYVKFPGESIKYVVATYQKEGLAHKQMTRIRNFCDANWIRCESEQEMVRKSSPPESRGI